MSATAQAEIAAATGVAAGEAAAALGTAQGQLGFQLTLKALDASTAVAVFPLLLVSLGAVAEGLAAYLATEARATAESASVRAAFQAATATARAAYARGQSHWSAAA
ncbi:MAG: hypothetical protein JSR82_22985 [Verrucomicrobia bacterium]|nr:hypothetical protein [Verrucomicrobiota bacterium]